jgi:hypothetical protein
LDIVDSCKYIHASRAEEVEDLLIKLRKHHLNRGNDNTNTSSAATANTTSNTTASAGDSVNKRSSSTKRGGREAREERPAPVDNLPPADMAALDDYLEMLYQVGGKTEKEREESLRVQERGTAMILKLCRDVMNLEQLIQNSTVMGALTRVLTEEFKRSVDLTFNILRIFLAFSNFLEMHSLMANYRIGALTMKALDFEVKRSEVREAEKKQREELFEEELQYAKEQSSEAYTKALEKIKKLREKEATKERSFQHKQDRLLFVGLYILLNLAEDASVEKKMIKKALVPSLLAMLSRTYEDLLVLTITFLKKLSIFEENKEVFKECNLVDNLLKFIPCSSQSLVLITLRLLFNLSFDKVMLC